MKEAFRGRDPRSVRATRMLGAVAICGFVSALLVASPAWSAGTLKDVRVGKHPAFTRIVFELDRPAGYQIERNEPAPGIAEIVVKLEASGTAGKVDVPKSLIEAVRVQSDGRRTVAHIRLSRDGLRHKEMTLREPARIVIDIIDDQARAAVKPKAEPKPTVVPKPATAPKSEPEPKTAARAEPAPKPEPKPVAKPKPVVKPEPRTAAKPAPVTRVVPEPKLPEPKAASLQDDESAVTGADDEAADTPSLARLDASADGPSDGTAPSGETEALVKVEPSGALPLSVPGDSSSDLFTLRNAALALGGIVLLAAGSFVIARRRREGDEYDEYDDDDYGDDNPFAGLEGAGASSSEGMEAAVGETVGNATEEQADLFAGTPATAEPADAGPGTIAPAGSSTAKRGTEGSDMSMDGTMDFGADPGAATTLAAGSGAGTDLEGVMRMVRELATRVGDLETRLEDAVDAKERLERQVAAQTEELRVQRAAIARTQRAVRNLSQSVEETPTEPAPRVPSPSE
jgi:hypothetical protein